MDETSSYQRCMGKLGLIFSPRFQQVLLYYYDFVKRNIDGIRDAKEHRMTSTKIYRSSRRQNVKNSFVHIVKAKQVLGMIMMILCLTKRRRWSKCRSIEKREEDHEVFKPTRVLQDQDLWERNPYSGLLSMVAVA